MAGQRFFVDVMGTWRPTSLIESMEFVPLSLGYENEGTWYVTLTTNKFCNIRQIEYDRILEMGWKHIPAAGGTYILEESNETERNERFYRIPVICWAVNDEGALRPLAADGESSKSSWAVLSPDGQVQDNSGTIFPTVEHYQSYLDQFDDD